MVKLASTLSIFFENATILWCIKEYLSNIKELSYLTQIVIKLFQVTGQVTGTIKDYVVEVHFTPGLQYDEVRV